VDGAHEGLAIARLVREVQVLGPTEARRKGRDAIAVRVDVEIPGRAALGVLFVVGPIAVVVDVVTDLSGEVANRVVEGGAVRPVIFAVVVVVFVHTVGFTVEIGVREAVVCLPVTVFVRAIADLHGRLGPDTGGGTADAGQGALTGTGRINEITRGGRDVVDLIIAVRVFPIALLDGAGIDAAIRRLAVGARCAEPRNGQVPVTDPIAVDVWIADVTEIIPVEVALRKARSRRRVVLEGAVVVLVDDAVIVIVGVHAVGNAVGVRVR
jgi:hypothetical protein